MAKIKKHALKDRRAHRTRARLHGTALRPRLSVFRSAKHFTAQLIDDDAAKTLVTVQDGEVKEKKVPIELSAELGKMMAEKIKKAGIDTLIFDRGSYAYHGRVKAFAEAVREGGIKF